MSGACRTLIAMSECAALCCAAACQPASSPANEALIEPPVPPRVDAPVPTKLGRWTPQTSSPTTATPSLADAQLLTACEQLDGGLMRVATRLAEHQARELAMLDTDQIAFELRSAGVPQVWPRAWSLTGEATGAEARLGVNNWLGTFNDGGTRRCGVGHARSAIGDVVAVVALDALADLSPVPRTARIGQWIELKAQLLAPASAAKVVVLGPSGAPRSVSASLRGSEVSARVPVDQPGQWLIQVLATLEGGPRPVAESVVFVEQEPPQAFHSEPVPGEHVGSPNSGDAVLGMLNAARRSEGLSSLRVHPELQFAAEVQAKAMMENRRVAHDVGLGGPAQRVRAMGLEPRILGENVARGGDSVLAHRALWASPSHRGNMLHERFTDVGVGMAEDADGAVWVCQLYATFQ